MTYTISISGQGRECRLHLLTDKQWQFLDERGIDYQSMTLTELTDYLDVVYDEGEKDITGTYANAPQSNVFVRDSDGQVVYDSSQIEADAFDKFIFNSPHWIGTGIDEKKWVCIGLNIRGEFMELTFEADAFDLTKLNLEVTNIGDRIELITGAYYDGSKLAPKWVDDYKEQGFQFFLNYPS
jgi:hypothetical protein